MRSTVLLGPSSAAPPQRLADYSEWRARDYFETYYSESILPDEERVLTYELEVLESLAGKCGRALEYGCGPTLHRAIAAARHVFRIDMADWLPDNLRQIRRWLQAGAINTDWNRFTRYILAHEARTARGARSAGGDAPACDGAAQAQRSLASQAGDAIATQHIERREALTRKVIRQLWLSDARWQHPLGPSREGFYDLIVSGFCIDAVSRDRRVWRKCMRNVLSTLRTGGLLVLHALHRCTAYRVADRLFPGADLSADDLLASLLENGFARSSIDIQFAPCPQNAPYGYSGILMASGRRR